MLTHVWSYDNHTTKKTRPVFPSHSFARSSVFGVLPYGPIRCRFDEPYRTIEKIKSEVRPDERSYIGFTLDADCLDNSVVTGFSRAIDRRPLWSTPS